MFKRLLVLGILCVALALSAGPAIAAPSGSFTDCSGTITSGTTAQNAIAANVGVQYRFILNPASASESLWINPTTAAAVNGEATGSIALTAGSSYLWSSGMIPTQALSVNATTSAHKFTCTYA